MPGDLHKLNKIPSKRRREYRPLYTISHIRDRNSYKNCGWRPKYNLTKVNSYANNMNTTWKNAITWTTPEALYFSWVLLGIFFFKFSAHAGRILWFCSFTVLRNNCSCLRRMTNFTMLIFQEQLHMLVNNEGENGCNSTVYVFNCILFTAFVWIWNIFFLECIPNNKSSLSQVFLASYRQQAIKSEPFACVCVRWFWCVTYDAYCGQMSHTCISKNRPSLVQIMAYRCFRRQSMIWNTAG